MMFNNYRDKEWATLRTKALKKDGFKCVRCGSIENLQIHHLSNYNYYAPDVEQLETLCKKCHEIATEEDEKKKHFEIGLVGELRDGEVYQFYITGMRF